MDGRVKGIRMWLRSSTALVLLVLVTSCSVPVTGTAGPDPSSSAGSNPPSTGPRSTPAVPAGGDPEVAGANESAERVVNDDWTRHWNETFTGEVDSFAPGSGSAFSLLPADNATGNFVRVVQRVPVKIRFVVHPSAGRRSSFHLVPGLSARVDVDRGSEP